MEYHASNQKEYTFSENEMYGASFYTPAEPTGCEGGCINCTGRCRF